MNENNSVNLSFWALFTKSLIKRFKSFQKGLKKVFSQFPDINQSIQLTFIYFFALVDLIHSVLTNVLIMGYVPELLLPVYPIVQAILQSPVLKIWSSPEKVFFLSYVVIEFMVVRSTFKFSKLVRYNILLIFSLLMIQGLIISYWDLLFHREMVSSITKWTGFEAPPVISSDRSLAIVFFLNTFFVFLLTYFYLYIRALQGKFATIPAMEWLSDSVAFWLRIKTPTMRFGKENEEKK